VGALLDGLATVEVRVPCEKILVARSSWPAPDALKSTNWVNSYVPSTIVPPCAAGIESAATEATNAPQATGALHDVAPSAGEQLGPPAAPPVSPVAPPVVAPRPPVAVAILELPPADAPPADAFPDVPPVVAEVPPRLELPAVDVLLWSFEELQPSANTMAPIAMQVFFDFVMFIRSKKNTTFGRELVLFIQSCSAAAL